MIHTSLALKIIHIKACGSEQINLFVKYRSEYRKGYALCHRPVQLVVVAMWGAWCLHFGTLGDGFGTSGAPWRTMGVAGWTRGGPEQDFHEFLIDIGTVLIFSRTRFQILFVPILSRDLDGWGSTKKVWYYQN